MKIRKKIDKEVKEVDVLITAPSDLEYQRIADKIQEKVSFVTQEGIILINKNDILYVKSKRNYLELRLDNRAFEIRSPLYKVAEKLGDDFIKVSRSYLINFEHLDKLDTDIIYGIVAQVSSFKIPVSKGYLKSLKEKIDKEENT